MGPSILGRASAGGAEPQGSIRKAEGPAARAIPGTGLDLEVGSSGGCTIAAPGCRSTAEVVLFALLLHRESTICAATAPEIELVRRL